MAVKKIDHLVLYVSDPVKSAAFYGDILGLSQAAWAEGKAVNLFHPESPNQHDLALYRKNIGLQRSGVFESRYGTPSPAEPPAGIYHVAWQVDTIHELEQAKNRLEQEGKLGLVEDHGTFKSVYGHDPDGLLFELTWIVPEHLLTDEDRALKGLHPVDWDKEKRRVEAQS